MEQKLKVPNLLKKKSRPRQVGASYYYVPEYTFCGFWTVFFVLLFMTVVLVPLVVLIARTPAPSARTTLEKTMEQCGAGEHLDENLQGCAPDIYVPVPVNNRLMDNNMGACQGFFRHACGNWIDTHETERYVARAFSYIAQENQYEVDQIINHAATHSPIRRFYESCVDAVVRRSPAAKRETEMEWHSKLGTYRSLEEIPEALHKLYMWGYPTPFWFSVEQHPSEPRMVIMARANRNAFVLPGDAELRRLYEMVHGQGNPRALELTAQLKAMVNAMRKLLDDEQDLEETYIHYVLGGDLAKDLYEAREFLDLSAEEHTGETPLATVYPLLNNATTIWLPRTDRRFFEQFSFSRFTLEQWRAFVEYSLLSASEDYFPVLPNDVYFRHHNPLRTRHSFHQLAREEAHVTEAMCQLATRKLLPGFVAQDYLARYFPGDTVREQVVEVVEAIRDRYAELIAETPWMDAATKEKAVKKIQNIIVRAVHPNQWSPEPFGAQIRKDRYLHNVNLVRAYRVQQNLALWNTQTDRDAISRFGSSLSTVNAWYSPTSNTITIFAGILRYPFFHPRYNKASMFSTIGMVAGHELAHAMDSHGIFFDEEGSLTRWFSAEAEAGFNERANCIMAEYAAPDDCPNENYSAQTLGEDIADILGIRMAYEAFFDNPKYEEEHKVLGVHQHFFFAFAQNWCEVASKEVLCNRVNDDVHAIASYRVDKTLRNIEYFQRAFNCPTQSEMVNPERCLIYGDK